MLLILHPSFEGVPLSKEAQNIEPDGDQMHVQDWLGQQLGHLSVKQSSKVLVYSIKPL